MTQEEKHLLLKDLCARLPYHLLGKDTFGKTRELKVVYPTGTIIAQEINGECCSSCGFVPYLRSMSSMTEEEKDYIKNVARFKQSDGIHYDDGVHYVPIYQETLDDQWKTDGKFPPILDDIYRFMLEYGYILLIDFFNSHHLDYRGLIEKGLALEAPKDMYNTKTE